MPSSLLPVRGAHIAEIDGRSLEGAPMSIRFGADRKPAVLLVFATTCGVCRVNWANWEKLSGLMKGSGSRLEYININSPLSQSYLDQHKVAASQVFAELDPRSRAALNLQVTPLTIIMRSDGTIDRYWTGQLRPDVVTKIPQILGTL